MSGIAGRLYLPRVAVGPLSAPPRRAKGPDEDWSEIEALLASPVPAPEAARSPSRGRHVVSVFVSSVAASVTFAGMLTAALWGLQQGCDAPAIGCAMPTAQAVAATAAPLPPARTRHVADAGAARSPSLASGPQRLVAVRDEAGLAEGRSSATDFGGAADELAASGRQQAVVLPSAAPAFRANALEASGTAEPRSWRIYDRQHGRAHGRHRYAWWR